MNENLNESKNMFHMNVYRGPDNCSWPSIFSGFWVIRVERHAETVVCSNHTCATDAVDTEDVAKHCWIPSSTLNKCAVLIPRCTDTGVLMLTLACATHYLTMYIPGSAELILKLAFSTSQTEGGRRTLLFPNSPIKVMVNTACFGSHTPLQSISMPSISSLHTHTLCAYRVIHCTRAHTYAIPLRSKVVDFQWQKGSSLIAACTRGSRDAFYTI